MSPDRRQQPRRMSDIWQVALVQVLGERVLSAPRNLLELAGRMGIVLITSIIFCAGIIYWRHPEIINRSLYRENPIELQLKRLPKKTKDLLFAYTKTVYDDSEAEWGAVFEWRTLKDVQPILTYGNIPSEYKTWHTLPQDWKEAMPDLIYENCHKADILKEDNGRVLICPILGDEDIWGFIVLYNVTREKALEVAPELKSLASRWSDYLY